MREIICINIGQGGVNLGAACWEIFNLEHSILPDGTLNMKEGKSIDEAVSLDFYENLNEKKFIPRVIFVDLESNSLNECQKGPLSKFFPSENFIYGKEDAEGIFAKGKYTAGYEILEDCLEKIRKISEKSSGLQGFFLFNSISGGASSGLGSLLLERIASFYTNITKIGFNIYPFQENVASKAEPYNSILSIHNKLEFEDLSIIFENEALKQIYQQKLNIANPNFKNLNRLISQIISSETSGIRFQGCLNNSLSEFITNLVPYPRIHSIISSYSPILSPFSPSYDKNNISLCNITKDCFRISNMMLKPNSLFGKYMAVSLSYRGNIVPKDVCPAICGIKTDRSIEFVDWCPTGFKCGINYQNSVSIPESEILLPQKSVSVLSNCTIVSHKYREYLFQFDNLFRKKEFIHWFLKEGMEFEEFSEARDNINVLMQDYKEIEADSAEIEEEQEQ